MEKELPKTASKLIPISQTAKFLGISIDTVRRWEKKGVLKAVRPNNKDRYFSLEDLNNFKKALKKAKETSAKKVRKLKRLKPLVPAGDFSIPQIKPQATTVEELLDLSRKAAERAYPTPLTESKLHEYATQQKINGNWLLPGSENIFVYGFKPRAVNIIVGIIASVFLFSLILMRLSDFQMPGLDAGRKMVAGISAQAVNPDVLAVESATNFLDFSTSVIIEGDLAVGGTFNKLTFTPNANGFTISGGDNVTRTLEVTGNTVALDQDVSVASSPTFQGLTVLTPIVAPSLGSETLRLTGSKNQLIFNADSANTGTLTWTPTSAVTLTLPSATDTLVGRATTDTLTNKTINAGDNTLSGSFTGITGLGTIAAGTWNGTKIGTTYGGTGLTSYTTGDILYASAANTLSTLPIGTSGQTLLVSGGLPAWSTVSTTVNLQTSVTGILPVANGGTGASTVTGVLKGNGTSAMTAMTGTTNYVTKWSDANTLSTSVIYDNGTNVGIGTTNPTGKLQVTADPGGTAIMVHAAASGTANIFDIMDNTGTTSYFSVDSSGQLSGSALKITDVNNAIVGTAIPGGWTLNGNTFTYRRIVTITNSSGSTMPQYYEMTLTLSAADSNQVYSNSQQTAPYKDFRVAYESGTPTEIARNVTSFTSSNVTTTFQLQAAILNGNSATYYLYYSNSTLASTPPTYTGDVTLDTAESTANWTVGDSAYLLSTEGTSPAPQQGSYSLKNVAQVDRMGTFATTNQGQLLQNLTDSSALAATIGATTYIYVVGGNNGTSDTSVIYKAAISTNNVGTLTTTTNQLPQNLSGASAVEALSFDSGSGGADLNTSTGVGCSGTGLSFAGSTCTITATGTYNFNSITVPTATTLTANAGVVATIKVTGNVSITGTVNFDAKGSAATLGAHPGGSVATNCADCSAGAGGAGYGGAGGAGSNDGSETGGTAGTSSTDSFALGSGGGNVTSLGNPVNTGGTGGGAVKIIAGGNITVNTGGIITANGADGTGNASYGGGGGGSGGAIFLQAKGNISNSGAIRANGGNGGAPSCADFTYSAGGGGGGGGGYVTLQDVDGATGNGTAATATKGNGGGPTVSCAGGYTGGAGSNGFDFTITPAVVVLNYYMYVMGGKNAATYQSTVYVTGLNVSTGDTTGAFATTSQGQLPQALYGHTGLYQSVAGANYVYVLGGNNGSTDVSTVYKSTITSGNLGAFATTSQGQLPQILSEHAQTTLTINGTTYLYIIGGKNTGTAQSTVYKSTIDPTTGNIGAFATTSQGQLPVALFDATAATATVGSVNYIFVLGGNNGSANVSTVYRATIDSSGNIGAFSTTGHAQLNAILSGHQTLTNVASGTTYFYTIGGTSAAAVSTIYKSTTTSDMTNFYIYKQISVGGIDLSNKNAIQFAYYSTNNASNLMEVAFSEDVSSPVFSQTATFTPTPANQWNTITWDISAITGTSRDSVKWIRFKVNTAQTTEFTTYLDNIKAVLNATTLSNTTTYARAILGSANLAVNAQGTGLVQINYSATPAAAAGSGGFAVFDGTTTQLFTVLGNGNVGIGTTNPAYPLDVLAAGTGIIARFNSANNTGCTLATGGTISCSSDENLKKNIADIGFGLDELLKLRPVEFNWRSEDNMVTKSLGFIAQEVEKVVPKLVNTDPQTGLKELNTIGLIPLITRSIQEQQAQINDLRLRVSTLSAKLSGTGSATLANQNAISELNLTPPDALLATTSAQLANLSVASEATIAGKLTTYTAVISDTFKSLGKTFLGETTVAGDLNIDTLSITGNSISSLDSLHIQNGPLAGNVDFFDGKIVLDKEGNIAIDGNLEIAGAMVITAVAGEDLMAHDVVYISDNNTVSRADSTILNKAKVIGLVAEDARLGEEVKIAISGKLPGFVNLIAGQKYYLGKDGQIKSSVPLNAIRNIQVGVAFDPTELLIQIFDFDTLIN